MAAKETLQAILLFLFGAFLLFFAWDMIIALLNNLDSSTYPLGAVLLWGSFLIATLLTFLVAPLLIVMSESRIHIISALKGYGIWAAAAITTVLGWRLATDLDTTLSLTGLSATILDGFVILVFVIILFFVPNLYLIVPQLTEAEE